MEKSNDDDQVGVESPVPAGKARKNRVQRILLGSFRWLSMVAGDLAMRALHFGWSAVAGD